MSQIRPVFMTVSLCCGLALPASAQGQLASEKDALRGLEAVFVLTDNPIGGSPGRPVVEDASLQTVIELTLRTAGILVQSQEEIQAKRRQNRRYREAYLYVGIDTENDFGEGPQFYTVVVHW